MRSPKKTRALKSADAATTSVTSPATSMPCCQNPLEITSSSLTPTFFPSATSLPVLSSPLFKDPELAGVQAGWRILNVHNNLSTLMGTGIVNVVHAILMPFMYQVTQHAIFCGSGELVRKKDLIELGGWTEGALTEDVDYSLRLIAAGKRIAYLDHLRVRCEVPYSASDLFRQQMRWAYGVVRAFMLHFHNVLSSRFIQKRVKLATLIFSSGYIMISLLLLTTIFGMLNMICGFLGFDPQPPPHPPTPSVTSSTIVPSTLS